MLLGAAGVLDAVWVRSARDHFDEARARGDAAYDAQSDARTAQIATMTTAATGLVVAGVGIVLLLASGKTEPARERARALVLPLAPRSAGGAF